MYLHQIDRLCPQLFHRRFHLGNAGRFAGSPHFGRDKQFFAQGKLRDQITGNLFRAAIHRRRIDHRPAARGKFLQYIFQTAADGRIVAHIECLPGTKADHRQHFTGRRNFSFQHFGCARIAVRWYRTGGADCKRWQRGSAQRQRAQQVSSIRLHVVSASVRKASTAKKYSRQSFLHAPHTQKQQCPHQATTQLSMAFHARSRTNPCA